MPETRNSKTSGGSSSTDKNPSNEFVTTAMLNEMLRLQERMFKSLADSLVTNFNSRLDTVVGIVAELKVLLRRNFHVMFILKNHLNKLMRYDCNLLFH